MKRINERMSNIGTRVRETVIDMTPRDRALLGSLLTTIAVVVFAFGFWWMDSEKTAMHARIDSRVAALASIQGQLQGHRSTQAEIDTLEQRLRAHSGGSLASFIERTATATDVNDRLTGVNSRQDSREDDLITTRYAMTLRNLTLEELVDFLWAVETDEYPVKISNMTISRTRNGESWLLSLSLELSAYSLASADNGASQ